MSHAAEPTARTDPSLLVPVKFAGVVLVCGDCEDRKDGPHKLCAKEVRKALKRQLSKAPQRTRVVQCSCLGLCPKKALALVASGAGSANLVAAEVRSCDEAASFAATAFGYSNK